jgi:lysozyme
MKLNEQGYKLIAKHEGLRLKPYLCPARVPTIGYGNTYYADGKRVTMQDKPITKEQAYELLKIIADKFARQVDTVVTANVTQNQFNALVSFAYNIGMGNFRKSTLLRMVNLSPQNASIRAQFMRWNKAGGVELRGLTNRRIDEANLYFTK